MLKYHNMTKHAHIYEQIILCYRSGLVRDIKRMKIIIIGKNMKDCRGYFRADIFRYLYDDDDQSFEGHIGEDIGQDWNHLNGEVARVSHAVFLSIFKRICLIFEMYFSDLSNVFALKVTLGRMLVKIGISSTARLREFHQKSAISLILRKENRPKAVLTHI